MKTKNKILFLLVATALFLCGSYYYYKHRQSVIEQLAKDAFVEAVDAEAYKRLPNAEMTIGLTGAKLLKKNEAPKYVFWYNESGKKKYKIDPDKHWKNVTMDSDRRTIHSAAFEDSPLNLDSLDHYWQALLQKEKLVCCTGIHMFSTDLNEKTTSLFTSHSGWFENIQPFWVCTIGYRCEMECFLYLQYSFWQVLGFTEIGFVLFYVFIVFTIYRITVVIRRKMTPERIIIEKDVLVRKVEFITSKLYYLGGDAYFDAEKRILSVGEKKVSLTNQPAELLELFLQADNHILSVTTIEETLWDGDGNYENRVYQVINRLRGVLKQFPSLSIDKVSVGNYRLKIKEL